MKVRVNDQVGILKGYYARQRGTVTNVSQSGTVEITLESGTVVYYYPEDISDNFITKDI